MINYYDILGIPATASSSDIKRAYRTLAVKYHPDKNPGNDFAEETFKQISRAYQVLGDPQQKAAYDFLITHQFEMPQSTEEPPEDFNPRKRTSFEERERYRQEYYEQNPHARPAEPSYWDRYRNNRLVNLAIAMLFFLVIAFFVGVPSYWYMKHEQKIEMERLVEEQMRFDVAKKLFEHGAYKEAMDSLQAIIALPNSSMHIKNFRNAVLADLYDKGEEAYMMENYEEAVRYWSVVKEHADYAAVFYQQLAHAYVGVGKFQQALLLYENMVDKEQFNIPLLLSAASLCADQLYDNERALKYYSLATEAMIDIYIINYGRAYALVIKPENIPESHYIAHYGLAVVLARLSNFERAKKACDWAILLRPNRPEAYNILGNCYFAMDQPEQACDAWGQAIKNGSLQANEWVARFCQ
ncbi:DnaJ domain-containing protein [Persicobacter psychrovividus]|uniref:J domain-containing protein n=1 Tax=Persicobacter psychrovividus TaxID=387638 RepID=A0ABM7VB35_9BACT|nr:hypothetical protein PEPS_03810 [Persicobacter psychrovividus]